MDRLDEMLLAGVIDICQRVFGAETQVFLSSDEAGQLLRIQVQPKRRQDILTQSQQEMDAILSIQHLLQTQSWGVHLTVV